MVSGVRWEALANISSGTAVITPVNATKTHSNELAVFCTLSTLFHVVYKKMNAGMASTITSAVRLSSGARGTFFFK